jgi:hypothetical protein
MARPLYLRGTVRTGYALLLISSLLALVTLVVARIPVPGASRLETGGPATASEKGFTTAYWLYVMAGTATANGVSVMHRVSADEVGEHEREQARQSDRRKHIEPTSS